MNPYFFRILFCISALFSFNIPCHADATFLSDIPFSDAYADINIIADTREYGIERDVFLDYMFSDEFTLGEKVALISALSAYFEWKSTDEEDNYFVKYGKAYTARLLNRYETGNINNAQIPGEYLLLHYLINDYDTTYPNLKNYEKVATLLPKSLTAQTIKLFSQAYFIIYNSGRTAVNKRKFDERYLNPFNTEIKIFNKDLRPKAVQDVIDWSGYIADCWSVSDLDNLSCYCEFSDEKSLQDCLQFAVDSLYSKIKHADISPKDHSSKANSAIFKKALYESIDKEKKYINSLQTSKINKITLLHFYLQQAYLMTSGLGSWGMGMGSNIAWYDYSSPYTEDFGKKFFENAECKKIDKETAFSNESPLYQTTCFKDYMAALDKDLNRIYKEAGGPSNTLLKETELSWIKLRDLYFKELGPNWEAYSEYKRKEILAYRVSSLYYYVHPDKTSELLKHLMNR